MSIEEIALRLNELSKEGHEFGLLQTIRKKHYKIVGASSPFAKFSIKDTYAFHAGGRKEFQFNFGINRFKANKVVFRYGLAFSLQRGQSVHDPIAQFRNQVKAFNRFLKSNPTYFMGYKMWYHRNTQIEEYFDAPVEINEEMFQEGNFIFIGKYLEKNVEQVSETDIVQMLLTFDNLMLLYKAVQFGEHVEKRIARLCWNSNGWVMPSGWDGKTSNSETHEGKYGYGHEEWLNDISKLIDGYHYAFLEPIRKQQQAYTNKSYHVWLYSIRTNPKKRYWIGEIDNVEVIDSKEADRVKKKYIKNGWLNIMSKQLKANGLKGLSNFKGVDLFNVRFKPNDLRINDSYIELDANHAINRYQRYTFAAFNDELNIGVHQSDDFNFDDDIVPVSNKFTGVKTSSYHREPSLIEVEYLHEQISQKLTINLKKSYGASNVKREMRAGYGNNRIDIVVKTKEGCNFYEIKSYLNARTSIREAIGQLLEYAHWGGKSKANKLIVVTQRTKELVGVQNYMKHLRNLYKVPIYYQYYELEDNTLSSEF